MRYFLLSVVVFFVCTLCMCSIGDVAGGGGDDFPNPSAVIIGKAVSSTGVPASSVEVTLIRAKHNPVYDGEIPDSLIDTTDDLGAYLLPVPDTLQRYNIEAKDILSGSRFFIKQIVISGDTTNASEGVLKDPGVVKALLPDSLSVPGGYVYVEGTQRFLSTESRGVPADSTISIIFDSLPQAIFNTIYYTNTQIPSMQVSVTESFEVIPNDTVLVGDSVVWVNYSRDNSPMRHDFVQELFIEENGTQWFGTYGIGAALWSNQRWAYYTVNNTGLQSDSVNRIYQDKTGKIWFATQKGVTSLLHNQIEHFTKENSHMVADTVTGIGSDSNGNIWVSTLHHGVFRYIPHVSWTGYGENHTPPLKNVFDVTIDIGDTVWAATDRGVVKFKDSSITVFDKTNSDLVSDSVLWVHIDKKGNKWFGQLHGVMLLSVDQTTWTYFDASSSPILKGVCNDIDEDDAGNIYIASDEGLTCYTGTKWIDYSGHRYSFLNNKEIKSVALDTTDIIWLGTKSSGAFMFEL